MALLIVLAALVLVSGIAITFLSKTGFSRQVSFSSAGQYRADCLAKTGLETLVGDLRTEVIAGSTLHTANGITLYVPANATVAPFRVGDQGYPNLVKKSQSLLPFWSGTSYAGGITAPVRAAANNSTASAAANGRYIQANRWNASYLLGDTLPGDFQVPDWILITRRGVTTNAAGLPLLKTLRDAGVTNLDYAVGRFAYAIYNEGGLLDATVAGYPNSVGTDFSGRRGLLPQVDLASIPGILDANGMVQWRNLATAKTALSYTNAALTSTNFLAVSSGDQNFASRQDLIEYVKDNPKQASTQALQYLGTFTREVNTPTFAPNPARPLADNAKNPSLIDTRVTASFIRVSDNTTAKIGEPLLKYRFPLGQIALFGNANTATADSTSQIYQYFGLTRTVASAAWSYRSNAATILTLAQVASAKREPDFFELLQAAILSGSLGKTGFSTYSGTAANTTADALTANQIIQIGANLIDQYDSDSYPTRITFNSIEYDGIERLPYLARVFETPYRIQSPSQPGYPNIGGWYQAEVWNPSGQTAAAPGPAPSRFRFVCTGTATFNANYTFPTTGASVTATRTFPNPASHNSEPSDIGVEFGDSPSLLTPTLLSPAAGATASSVNEDSVVDGSFAKFVGVHVADVPYFGAAFSYYKGRLIPLTTDPINHLLQYWDGSQWITYNRIRNVVSYAVNGASIANSTFSNYLPVCYEVRADPRTDRFGVLAGSTQPQGTTLRPTPTTPYASIAGAASATGWVGITAPLLGYLSDNNKLSSATYYSDPDGIVRRADGAYSTGTAASGGYPLATDAFNAVSSRPIVLNHPFRSVADMGYAFRDQPWKHLDFFTSESADAALLDFFCLNQSPPPPHPEVSTDPVPIAGRVDLNTRQTAVLAALLSGAMKVDETSVTLSPGEATALAANLAALTLASPLLNRSELVTRWISSAAGAPPLFGTTPDGVVKRRREAAVRALTDAGNTRTWNLLIDIIAQGGRYPAQAATLNDFLVEGERRYWLHVAIDRYTGAIVDQLLEPVQE